MHPTVTAAALLAAVAPTPSTRQLHIKKVKDPQFAEKKRKRKFAKASKQRNRR